LALHVSFSQTLPGISSRFRALSFLPDWFFKENEIAFDWRVTLFWGRAGLLENGFEDFMPPTPLVSTTYKENA
jgi:hypothetical protein